MEHRVIESCGALIYCRTTHRYLFLLRNNSKHSGSWGLVGGKIEKHESIIDGLHREINEEIGSIDYEKIVPIEKFTSENGRFFFHTYAIVVDCEFVPTLNHEHRGYCWVPLKDHPRPLHPGVWRSFKFTEVIEKLNTIETLSADVGFKYEVTHTDSTKI